jgi:mannose-6-phosphate isomerase-like protein (cupin superfamily)
MSQDSSTESVMMTIPPTPEIGGPSRETQHAWGRSWLYLVESGMTLYRFTGMAGGASSYHLHENKVNVFVVMKGILEIDVDRAKRRIYGGQSFTVPIGAPHRMTFITDVLGFELYYTVKGDEIEAKDIIRLDPGWTPDGKKYQQWQA